MKEGFPRHPAKAGASAQLQPPRFIGRRRRLGVIRAARPSCFFHGFSLSKFFPWERYGFESCAFNSEVKKKRKRKTPQIVWSMTETQWGERIIPSKTNRMRDHISSSIIQSGGATVGRERLAPCWRTRTPTPSVFEVPSAGIQICEPDQLKSFPPGPQPGVKTQSLSSLRVLVLEA